MWLDMTDDGICHVGIDAFLSRALGKIDRIRYLWLKGRHQPSAVLTVAGLDLVVVFPNSFEVTNCNLYLQADPSRLTAKPYTSGWLFEGVPAPDTTQNLLQGAEARAWMEQDQQRINEFLQQQQRPGGLRHAADGGQFVAGLGRFLERDQMLALFHEFFSPYASWKREA
jgi:glycine cleavage system H lipoate-binding protein